MNQAIKTMMSVSLFFIVAIAHGQTASYEWRQKTEDGYTYAYVTNDPTNARFYKLKNGLTVILSPNTKKPRIQTYIATKAGSKTDPKNHTGLAHYLEHMLFKGTDKFGSLDWIKEKPLLDSIDILYELYNHETDESRRLSIYKQIDKISGDAAKFAIPNEYDKLMSNIGSEGTNAFTSFEQTVYIEDIPNTVVDKYLAVQAERFRNPILRLFHTELESVYEEKNISLDNDSRKATEMMFASMFPNNNYGKQTTLGSVEHLKNPSLKAIRDYYETYYVPNNMGIIMSGDFSPSDMVKRIEKAFAYMQPKPIPIYSFEGESIIASPIVREVNGPTAEYLLLGFRFPGAGTKDAQTLNLLAKMLNNGSAGLIDLNVVKSQKLLGAGAFPYVLKDYSLLILQGNPSKGQSLDDVRHLLLAELDKLRKGNFSDDLIASIVNNEKKSQITKFDNYSKSAEELMSAFTSEIDWCNELSYVDRLSKITKKDVINFANKYLSNDNYVAVYKRQGIDQNVVKVVKPPITPITLNRDHQSSFFNMINEMPEETIKPVWINYDKHIVRSKLHDIDVIAVENQENELFSLTYQFDFGKWDNKLLGLATGYLEFLGTKNRTSEEFSKAFYKLASSFTVSTGNEETRVSLSGLNSNFGQSIDLIQDLMQNCVVDEDAFNAYLDRIKKSRANAKENKSAIMEGLRSYARFGQSNPFNYTFSDSELSAITALDLVKALHNLANAKHTILYYGPQTVDNLVKALSPLKKNNIDYYTIQKGVKFTEYPTDKNLVLFTHYNMKQVEIFWQRNSGSYNSELTPTISLFNAYFGGGMGSIVFQTLRESKALAYTTYAFYSQPQKKENSELMAAYIGTQTDKFKEAVAGMNELLNDLPTSVRSFETAKTGLMKSIQSERVTGSAILSRYLSAQRLGLKDDVRKTVYEKLPKMTFEELKEFHSREIKNKKFVYCIVGNEENLKEENLKTLGELKVLTLEEIFGY